MAQVVALNQALRLELKHSEAKLVEFQERGQKKADAESNYSTQGRPPTEAPTSGRPEPSRRAQEEANLPANPGELSSGSAPPEQEEPQLL